MNRRYVLAIDPGKTTGIAFWDNEDQRIWTAQANFLETCVLLHTRAFEHKEDLVIVSESFVITIHTAKNTQAQWSIELIGVARFMSQAYCGLDLVTQQPAAAKRFSSDDRLKTLGWYKPGQGHANDAARHLLLYLVSHGWRDDRLVT